MPNLNIFVVDDDPSDRMIATFQLDDPAYAVSEYDNGEACLAALGQSPDILLLDVEMPGMNGIDLCRAVRGAGHHQAQVIFISAHDDLNTRLTAYDAGGNDYIVKPYSAEELARKIRLAEVALEERRGLSDQAHHARQAAFTAMSSMGEMGVVLECLRASFACRAPGDLARALFQALEQYGLDGLAELRPGADAQAFSSAGGTCSALELSILGHARGMGRIFQFSDRMAVNYPHVTLLVSGLPLDDPDRVGRLRDHLAVLAEGVEARIIAMGDEAQRLRQAEAIGQAAADLTATLGEVEARHGDNRIRILENGNVFLEEMERAFIHMGLNETQEAELIAMARKAMARASEVMGEDKGLGDRLQAVIARLRETLRTGGRH